MDPSRTFPLPGGLTSTPGMANPEVTLQALERELNRMEEQISVYEQGTQRTTPRGIDQRTRETSLAADLEGLERQRHTIDQQIQDAQDELERLQMAGEGAPPEGNIPNGT